MRVCYTSYRTFADGPVKRPFPESDPANLAYALGGSYISFYTLKKLSHQQLADVFRPFDLIFVSLDVEAIDLVQRIVRACEGRAATYSEGHIADYQQLPPAGQVTFLQIINSVRINFLYWEKYIPFYRSLTDQPVAYLPYPYILDDVRQYTVPAVQRQPVAALPSGLAGATRNGLATLAVAKQLLKQGLIGELICWLDPDRFEEDAEAVKHFLFAEPFRAHPHKSRLAWRQWLVTSRIDYRPLLNLKAHLRPKPRRHATPNLKVRNITFYRRQGWPNYLSQLAPAYLLIHLSNRETVGRNALDCAALKIPCVSTDRSDLQPRLFPQTTLRDSWDIETALELCRRLLCDARFYEEVVSYACDAVRQFDVPVFRQRFQALCDEYPQLMQQSAG